MYKSALTLKWVAWIAGGSLTIGGGLGLWALGTPFQIGPGRPGDVAVDTAVLELMIVHLSDDYYLRIKLGVQLKNSKAKELFLRSRQRIRDSVVPTLSNHTRADLQTSTGRLFLREEIERKIHATMPDLGIRSVYFVEFLIHS